MIKSKKTIVSLVIMVCSLILFLSDYGVTGSLEPTSTPGPTMKTLDQIPPTWSQKLSASDRFELVLDDAAVLDKETGLVWDKSPSGSKIYETAEDLCLSRVIGSRMGFRLPTAEELSSLIDRSQTSAPYLPSGHPFSMQSGEYWSSSSYTGDRTYRWTVDFSNQAGIPGQYDVFIKIGVAEIGTGSALDELLVWCVRGGN